MACVKTRQRSAVLISWLSLSSNKSCPPVSRDPRTRKGLQVEHVSTVSSFDSRNNTPQGVTPREEPESLHGSILTSKTFFIYPAKWVLSRSFEISSVSTVLVPYLYSSQTHILHCIAIWGWTLSACIASLALPFQNGGCWHIRVQSHARCSLIKIFAMTIRCRRALQRRCEDFGAVSTDWTCF